MNKIIKSLCIASLLLWGCNNDEQTLNPEMNSPLTTSAEFIKLTDDNSNVAGLLEVTSNACEVNVKWNTEAICNLDTTQTVIRLKNGRGILPIKWQKKQEEGTHGPVGVAYKAGVELTAGDVTTYVPLLWAEKIDTTEVLKSIHTQTRAVGDPKVAQIVMTPTTVHMNYANGGGMFVSLTDVPFVIFDTSEITSDLNIDMSQIPTMITEGQYIPFKWTAAGAPSFEFTVNFIAMSEGIIQTGAITYTPGGDTPGGLTYVNSTLPAGNIPQMGGTYTFTFEGTYTGNVQVRALAAGVVVATGAEVGNKQPSVTVPANTTGANRNITFQYRLGTGAWINLPATTNRIQDYAGGGGAGGIVVAGYTWAPGNLTKNGTIFQFHTTQSQYSGIWSGGDYWNWCVLDPYTYTTSMTNWNNANDPCRQVAPAGTWRTPTSGEMQALVNTVNSWGALNGVSGRFFGPNNELFLPAAGWRENRSTAMSNKNIAALYWTSTAANAGYAYALGIQNNNVRVDNLIPRSKGVSIRCISAR